LFDKRKAIFHFNQQKQHQVLFAREPLIIFLLAFLLLSLGFCSVEISTFGSKHL
jgi:hypothetical protein